jgi:N-dimethylarginine dimethylaminohydrolase
MTTDDHSFSSAQSAPSPEASPRRICSHNEWDPLREVIVGTAEGSMGVLTWNKPGPIPEKIREKGYDLAGQAFPQWFVDEINEDLEGLCDTLRGCGVKVLRPTPFDLSNMFSTQDWSSTSNNIYNTRDLHLVVGNTVIESSSPVRSRYHEASALYPIWYEYFERGFRWIVGPKPRLVGDVLPLYYRDAGERVLTPEDVKFQKLTGGRLEELHKLTEDEILFEAANTLRMGRDLLYLVSSSGNWKAAKWLQQVLGEEYRIHTTDKIYRSSHIDSTVLCLRPGLVILNSARVTPEKCPEIFEKWEKVYFGDIGEVAPSTEEELSFQRDVRDRIQKELADLGFESNLSDMASPWVGLNFLSVDTKTVLVDRRQEPLIRLLEGRKFTVIPVRMRHIYTQGGGLHCATLDTVRDGELQSYFD